MKTTMKRILLLCSMVLSLGAIKAADTTYNGETVSVTWSMSEGEENSKAVLSDRKTVMDFGWACGPGFGIAATPTRTVEDKTFTVFYPQISEGNTTGNWGDDYYIEWTLTPYDALSFTPTKVKLDAVKIGTDAPKMNIYIIDGAGNVNEVATNVDMARIDGSHAFNAETNNWEKEYSLSGCTASPNAVKLRVYVAKCAYNKTFSLANVIIEGTVTGVSHFREEYAVNIAPNNSEWGTVKSTKDYVVEENPVTLTATPNRGYRFLGWSDASNNYVSTEASYTFVPEADINLTAVFEPLAVYQVEVTSNIEGAGIVSVTTFDDGIYYEGDIIDISALPNQGYVFTGWSDGKTIWKRETITLAANVNLTATFEPVGEPAVYAYWSMSDDTNAEITGEATASFSISSLTDTENTVTIDGATMRTFTAIGDVTGSVTFNLGVTTSKGQVFVVRSIEFDAARVGTSYGTFSISIGGTDIASNLYPGVFSQGVDYPHTHYYYNLGQSLEFQSNVPITLSMKDVSTESNKGIAIGNVKLQGYYKTKEVEVTIPYTGYAAYSSRYALGFGNTSITSYIAKANGSEVTFTQISNAPANTGLLLKGTPGSYMVPVVESGDNVEDNVLMPMLDGGNIQPTVDDMQNMRLLHKTNRLAFFTLESASTLDANTAYMQVPTSLGIEYVDAPYQEFTLDENALSSPTAFAKGATVTVKRTINANEWSTICLPFAMTEQQVINTFGNDVKVAAFDKYTANADRTAIVVSFIDADLTNDGMMANCPYIIKTSWNMTNFTLEDVDLLPEEENAFTVSDDEKGKFIGTYHAQTAVPENCLFLSGNKFWYSKGLTMMKAFRAYFNFADVLASVEDAQSRISMSFDSATAIDEIENRKSVNSKCFDLQGRRVGAALVNSEKRIVNNSQLKKGLYIRDGKKVIVR